MLTLVDPCFATQKTKRDGVIVVVSADNIRPIVKGRNIGFVIKGPWSRRLRTETLGLWDVIGGMLVWLVLVVQ